MALIDDLKKENKKRIEADIWLMLDQGRSKDQIRRGYKIAIEKYDIDIEKIINEVE